jgi:hypothetical protein
MERDNADSTHRDAPAGGLRAALDVRSTLVQAVAAHQQGRLAEARAGYEEILLLVPEHFDVLHLLGVTALQQIQLEEGVAVIRRALGVNPCHAAAHLMSCVAEGLVRRGIGSFRVVRKNANFHHRTCPVLVRTNLSPVRGDCARV